jgi:ATP-dependent RNA helicase DDX55/SPB4
LLAEFLAVKNVPIQVTSAAEGVHDWLSKVKQNAAKERELVEKVRIPSRPSARRISLFPFRQSVSAFTSYFRAYKEHKLNYTFRLKDLNLPSVARSYALLRLPKMPEMSLFDTSGFQETVVDFAKIPYKEKRREKQRQDKLKRLKEERDQKDAEWKKRQDKMDEDAESDDDSGASGSDSDDSDMSDSDMDSDGMGDDDDDLAKEARLMKKLKQGKITEEEFEAELGETTLEQDIEESYKKAQDKKKQKKAQIAEKRQKKQDKREPKLFQRQTQTKKRRAAFQAQEKAVKKRKFTN